MITHVVSVGKENKIVLFYDETVPFFEDGSSRPAATHKSFALNWNGAAWSGPRPNFSVSEAFIVGSDYWALTDGGYKVSTDAETWSALKAQPDWEAPFGCVLSGKPHVFYHHQDSLFETVFDGKEWEKPRIIPGKWKSPDRIVPFDSSPQAGVISDKIHLFFKKQEQRREILVDLDLEDPDHPKELGPYEGFRILRASDGLHLFYQDMTPPQVSSPSITTIFSTLSEMQSRMMRVSHRVLDADKGAAPESIMIGQAISLSAAQTDDALWLFGSSMAELDFTVRRDGRWSPLKAVPGTAEMTSARVRPLYAKLWWIWLLLAVPAVSIFGAIVWMISAVIETRNPVELDLPSGRVRCASLLRRAAAHIADGFLLGAVGMLFQLALSFWKGFPDVASTSMIWDHFFAVWASMMLLMISLYFGFFAGCEALWGRTPGKRVLGIRVVGEGGTLCTWKSAAIRNALRVVDVLPYYLIGVITFAASKKHQRVGDMAAHTLVILDRRDP